MLDTNWIQINFCFYRYKLYFRPSGLSVNNTTIKLLIKYIYANWFYVTHNAISSVSINHLYPVWSKIQSRSFFSLTGNIVLICCTFFIIFGILGVQLFKGDYKFIISIRSNGIYFVVHFTVWNTTVFINREILLLCWRAWKLKKCD